MEGEGTIIIPVIGYIITLMGLICATISAIVLNNLNNR